MTNYKYGAADLFIVCILRPDEARQEIDIVDRKDIKAAKWISLDSITASNEADKCKIFPSSY